MGLLLRREEFFFSLSLKQECFAPKCNTKTKLHEKKMKTCCCYRRKAKAAVQRLEAEAETGTGRQE